MSTEPNPYQSPQCVGETVDRTADGRRQRSTFWIVSTHVVTTAIAVPFLIGVFFPPVLMLRPEYSFFLAGLAVRAVGYIAGTYYSLSYLRKATTMQNPQRCVKTSVIAFVVLALLSLTANIVAVGTESPLRIAAIVVFHVVICLAFARITKRGFAQMAGVRS